MAEHSRTLPWTPVAQVKAHQESHRHGCGNGEGTPRAAFERIHDYQTHHREQNNHDDQHGEERRKTAYLADLFARHLAKGFAIAAHGSEEDDEVLHRAAQDGADDDPQGSG